METIYRDMLKFVSLWKRKNLYVTSLEMAFFGLHNEWSNSYIPAATLIPLTL